MGNVFGLLKSVWLYSGRRISEDCLNDSVNLPILLLKKMLLIVPTILDLEVTLLLLDFFGAP